MTRRRYLNYRRALGWVEAIDGQAPPLAVETLRQGAEDLLLIRDGEEAKAEEILALAELAIRQLAVAGLLSEDACARLALAVNGCGPEPARDRVETVEPVA